MKICKFCHKEFESKAWNAKFCSSSCQWQQKRGWEGTYGFIKSCRHCSNNIITKKHDKIFCNKRCANSSWIDNNKENYKVIQQKYTQRHKSKKNAMTAKRRAIKSNATPIWLTATHYNQIQWFYIVAKILEKLTNEKYHVDHIVPLQGNEVKGLHVPWNLQVLKAKDNLKKSNRFVTR